MCGELWIRKRQPGDGGACLFPGRSGGLVGDGRWPQPRVTCEAAIKINNGIEYSFLSIVIPIFQRS